MPGGRPFVTPPSCDGQEGQALVVVYQEPLSASSRRAALCLLIFLCCTHVSK